MNRESLTLGISYPVVAEWRIFTGHPGEELPRRNLEVLTGSHKNGRVPNFFRMPVRGVQTLPDLSMFSADLEHFELL